MDYKEYKNFVIDSEHGSLTDYSKILHAVMGLNGESGECVDILKKHIFQGHVFDIDHLLSELGDVCWYAMLLCVELNINVDLIFDRNEPLIVSGSDDGTHIDCLLDYILDLNRHCGSLTGVYKKGVNRLTMGMSILQTIRYIFRDISKSANIFDETLEDIFEINYRKIKSRYPGGFDVKLSKFRDNNIY